MEEARRFLRYVAPGLVFLIELGVLAWLGDPPAARRWAIGLLTSGQQLGVIVTLLVVSGGVGAIFTHVHHLLHWNVWVPVSLAASHLELTSHMKRRGYAVYLDQNDEELQALTPRQAWIAVTILWYGRLNEGESKAASDRVTALADLAHSSGTILVASLVAALFGISLAPGAWGVWVAAGLLIFVHAWSYRNTSLMSSGSITGLLLNSLGSGSPAAPVRTVVVGP